MTTQTTPTTSTTKKDRAPGPAPSPYPAVEVGMLVSSPTNPRKHFDPVELAELAKSIKEVGMVQPIVVREIAGGQLEIVAGERRWRAAKLAELAEVPVRILVMTDEQALEIQVVENLQRKDLNPLEEADGYKHLLKAGYDVARIAGRIGRSAKYVYDRLKLFDLIEDAKTILTRGQMTAGHAILIARLAPTDQKRALQEGALFLEQRNMWRDLAGTELNREELLKVCSVRELEVWIEDHVRFDPAKGADPLLFPETALKLDAARQESTKIVAITNAQYIPEEARAAKVKTLAPGQWRRADGEQESKTCDFSLMGVVAIGPGRGQAFPVCEARNTCKVHFGPEIRAAAQRHKEDARVEKARTAEGSATPGAKAQARVNADLEKRRRAEDKLKAEAARKKREEERWRAAKPALLTAIAEKVKRASAGGNGVLADLVLEAVEERVFRPDKKVVEMVPRGRSAEDLVRHAAFLLLAEDLGYRDDRLEKRLKAIGVDVKKVLDQAAPLGPEKPAKKKSKGRK